MKSYIVDMGLAKKAKTPDGKTINIGTSYVVLTETGQKNQQGMPLYAIDTLNEQKMVEKFNGSKETVNFRIDEGKVKHKVKDASLSRFNQPGYKKTKPFIVLAEIHADNGRLMGYLIATNNGFTYSRKVDDFINDCKELVKKAAETCTDKEAPSFKPVQNMKLNADGNKAFLSIYNEANPLPVIILQRKENKFAAKKAEIPAEQASKKEVVESLYTKKQLAELKEAKANGVDIRIISNPKLSAEQMHEIWTVEKKGYPARDYAQPEYSVEMMNYYGIMMQCGWNVDAILNPKYNKGQATEILSGIRLGLDVNKYSDPNISADDMHRLRRDLEYGMWGQVYFEVKNTDGTIRTINQPFKKEPKKAEASGAKAKATGAKKTGKRKIPPEPSIKNKLTNEAK